MKNKCDTAKADTADAWRRWCGGSRLDRIRSMELKFSVNCLENFTNIAHSAQSGMTVEEFKTVLSQQIDAQTLPRALPAMANKPSLLPSN